MMRRIFLALSMCALAACSAQDEILEPPVDLGNFQLGHNVVVAPFAETSGAVGREVSEDELTAALTRAIDTRFNRYEGARKYHLGVSVEGYILARAGVPVVAAPKSAMIIRVTVWDDAAAKKLNVPPEQMTIIEDLDGEALIGTGWTQSADEQLDGLARNAAKAIEDFLLEQNIRQGWFMEEGYVPPPIEEPEADSAAR
jgi:hypothetical protein